MRGLKPFITLLSNFFFYIFASVISVYANHTTELFKVDTHFLKNTIIEFQCTLALGFSSHLLHSLIQVRIGAIELLLIDYSKDTLLYQKHLKQCLGI